MNKKSLQQLILHTISYVNETGGYTTTIRLVKFLYLFDLEHFRRYRKTLTGLEWVFHLYGPYCFALPELGQSIGFDLAQEDFESQNGRKGRLYKVAEEVELPNEFGYSVGTMIDGLLDVWGLEETQTLLDYVYHTEPMKSAVRGQKLIFDDVPAGSQYYELYLPIDKKKAAEIRQKLTAIREDDEKELVVPKTKRDDTFLRGIESLQESSDTEFIGIYHKQGSVEDLRNYFPEGD
jgi:hypothetical protein